jgi:cold-inducible RNA-binding protein
MEKKISRHGQVLLAARMPFRSERRKSMNIYVGNLSPETTEDDLRQAFGAFGEVVSVKILRNRVTGESNGLGFVGMAVSEEGEAAITTLNGSDLQGRAIKVELGKRQIDYRRTQDKRDGFGGDRGDRDRRDRFGRGGRRY